jgi:hypothetical protein
MNGKNTRQFLWFAGAAVAVKLWLTSFIAINPWSAPHDYTNFLEHAKNVLLGTWFGPYDVLTLIKGPGMPIYLAFIREIGLPLPIAHVLVYSLACAVACWAIRPAIRQGWVLGSVFIVLEFDPFTFGRLAWMLNRSQLMDTLALLVAGCGVGAAIRAASPPAVTARWLALLGAAVAAIVLTREDTVWIVPSLLVFLVAYVWAIVSPRVARKRLRAALLLIPFGVYGVCVGTIMWINGAEYGWKTAVETTSPEFVSAYQSLTRIVVPGVDPRTYPAPEAAREMAFRASPAAAELKPGFDEASRWKQTSCALAHLCDDVSAGWFLWYFREAVAVTGHYDSGATARAYYKRLSQELDAACDAGKLTCRHKNLSLAPPLRLSDIPSIVRLTAATIVHVARFDEYTSGAPAAIGEDDDEVSPDYEEIAGSDGGVRHSYVGWLLRNRGSSVSLEDPVATDVLNLKLLRSPDVAAQFGSDPAYKSDLLDFARFVVTTTCATECFLDVTSASGGVTRIPLQPNVTDFKRPAILYHLEAASAVPDVFADSSFKGAALEQIAIGYQQIVPCWTVLAAVALVVRAIRAVKRKRARLGVQYLLLVAGIVIGVVSYCTVLATVSTVSFDVLYDEYEIPLFPLLLFWLTFETSLEAVVAVRWLRTKLPSPTTVSRSASAR